MGLASGSSSPTSLSEPPDDFETSDHDLAHQPPSKRRRIGNHLRGSPATIDSPSSAVHQTETALEDISDVSSDSEGSVPGSSRLASLPGAIQDEDAVGAEQMRLCSWDGCDVGELANQDDLVDHVHRDHVNNAKKAKFACEWSDCKAKGKAQMSAYALRAHIRSHTKEKPFYCLLPECDKCFTRSDALAKHMRTVHENESVRTAEHYTKRAPAASGSLLEQPPSPQDQPTNKAPITIKLNLSSSKNSTASNAGSLSTSNLAESSVMSQAPLSPTSRDTIFGPFPEGIEFSQRELSLSRDQLFGLLRRQIGWAEQDAQDISRQILIAEEQCKHEWLAKEMVLGNLLEAEIANADSTGVLTVDDTVPPSAETNDISTDPTQISADIIERLWRMEQELREQPIKGTEMPWYRASDQPRSLKNGHVFLKQDKLRTDDNEILEYMSEA